MNKYIKYTIIIWQCLTDKATKKSLTVQKPAIRAHSDIAQIKRNYNANNKKASPKPIYAPPPPMAQPPISPRSKKNQQNLLDQDIEAMGFIQLKARCGMEGLSTFGTKKQLLGRLRQHLQKQGNGAFPSTSNNINSNKPNKNNLKTDHDVLTKPNGAKHRKKNYSTQVNSYTNSIPKKRISSKTNIIPNTIPNINPNINNTNSNISNISNNNNNINNSKGNASPVKPNDNTKPSWNSLDPTRIQSFIP